MHINLENQDRPDKTAVDLRLYHFGYESCLAAQAWGPGIKDHFKIHVVFEGTGAYQTPQGSYVLSAGDVFLTTPNTVVSYKASSEDPWTYGWFAFNGMNARLYLQRAGLSIENPVLRLKNPELVKSTLHHMTALPSKDASRDLELLSCLYLMLAQLVASGNSVLPLPRQLGPQLYIEAALSYIETNFSRQMRIDELAAHIGISRKYLARLFATHFGTSPQQFLVTYRMERAKLLLERTALSVAEVAVSVGYPDAFAFSKRFKQCYSLSPSHFRQKQGSDI